MDCPRCGEDLDARHRGGVEVDVCPRCGGVWLDRGELDKLLYEDDGPVIGAPGDAPQAAPGRPSEQAQPSGSPRSASPRSSDGDSRSRHDRARPDRADHPERWEQRATTDRKSRKKRKKESVIERLADALEDIFD